VKTRPRPQLFYDQDCGFCRWSLLRILHWSGDAFEPVPSQSERAAEALPGMDQDRRMASWHLLLADGSVYSAGAAVPELMRFLPGVRSLAPAARRFHVPIDALYRLVARHRHQLSRFVGERSCAVPNSTDAAPKR
jgi:predicted DCC family thiol-disulfide oxidoreductase YuxK